MPQNTFIGRETELQQLQALLGRADAGQLQVAFIADEAGLGKTSLVDEFIRHAEESDPTLITSVGECNAQTGSGDPYLPFRQVLTSLTTDSEEHKSSAEIAKTKGTARIKEFVRVSSQTLIMLGPLSTNKHVLVRPEDRTDVQARRLKGVRSTGACYFIVLHNEEDKC
jgi:predicted ATPase